MERFPRPIWLVVLGMLVCASTVQAQYEVEIGIKETDGRWKDTLLAGETNVLTVSITNPDAVASYTLPFKIVSEAFGAFAVGGDTSDVVYVGRMSNPTNPFTIRTVNVNGIDGDSPDSVLFGAVEFGANNLPVGTGIVIEYSFTVDPYVGSVRIDTALLPPSNRLSFTLPDATEITDVAFNANPVFPVVLRVPNSGPSCSGPSDVTVPFGTPIAQLFTGSDPEGNALTFKQVSGPGSTNAAGSYSWTPGCADVGTHEVCVTISDPNHLDWDTCCFTIEVTQTAPSLACTDQAVHYDDTLSYVLSGSDDGCPQALQYFKTSGPGTLNPTTGEYRYTPGCPDVGSYLVEVGVTDGQDTATCSFQVNVTNSPPQLNCPPNFSAGIGDTVDFQVQAVDADGDELTFTLLDFVKLSGPTANPPNTAPTLSASGLFFWPTSTDNDDDFGVWEVSLRVDESCDSAFCSFEIEVTPNRPPVCTPPSDLKATWDESPASAKFSFSDPDGDPITFQQISGPGTLSANGTWSWAFGCAEVGVYEICAVVADSAFPNGDTCCFTFEVIQAAPKLACRDTAIHAGSGTLQMSFATTDDGCPGTPVRYYKVSGQGTIDSATGLYTLTTLTPGFGCSDIGSYPVTIYATDGQRADTCDFTVTISNNRPVFSCPVDDETVQHTVDRPFVYNSDPVDPDGDALISVFLQSIKKLAGPPGGPNQLPSVDSAGVVTWVTDSSNTNDLGVWRLVLEARDTCSISRCTLLVEVHPNRPPTCLVQNTQGHVTDSAFNGVLGLDPDGDSLTFKQISGPGTFIVAEDAARWTWVPECGDLGTYQVCFTLSDPVFEDYDTCCFDILVFENPPVLFCSTQTVHYGDSLVYDIAFEDDACPQAATFALLDGPGTIDPNTGRYQLETACIDVGTIPVTVELFDGNRADTSTFDVVVTNTTPFVDCPGDLLDLKVGATVNLTIPFGDADGDPTTIDLVSFQKLGGANPNPPNNPPTLDAGGNFQWITDFNNLNDVATWEVTVRVDELCDSASCKFRIEILPNEAPVCTSPADFEGVCDQLNSALFEATDVEDDAITFTLVSGPGVVDPNSGAWSWTPPCDSGGLHEVCVTVSDFLHPDADTCCFRVSICAVGAPGDVDGDGLGNITDIILMVNFMFKSGTMPFGDYTADMNCDGLPNSEDIIVMVNYVFKSGDEPCDACTSPLFPGLGL